jgi:hypothetical protein
MTAINARRENDSFSRRILRTRWIPFAAAATAAALTAGAIASAGGGAAGAATPPQAQSVGNFLDAAVNGQAIDDVAKLEYATAKSPGTQSTQNPLDATVLNALELPLTGALQLPNLAGITLGAANQVAVARHDGSSYGASGAVSNSGGVSAGGNNAYPADSSIDLCASAVSGGTCGSTATDALGELNLGIGAVSGLAQTPKGYAKSGSAGYNIAALNLQLGSPQLGALLGQVTTTLTDALSGVTGALTPISTLLGNLFPSTCALTPGSLGSTLTLAGGAVTVDVTHATITVDIDALLKTAQLDLNNLPPNTDLVAWLVDHLSDVLTNGIAGIVNGLLDTLKTTIDTCLTALGPLAQTLGQLLTTLQDAVTTTTTTLNGVLAPITSAIAPLLGGLSGLVDVGVNVQPNGPAGTFTSGLTATPKQGTPVVTGQTIVRAIEVDVLSTGNVNRQAVGNAAKAADPLVALALGNAAAGPSAAPGQSSSPASPEPSTSVPATNIPTGVPAGMGTHGRSPVLPITLLVLGLMFAAGGAAAFRLRGRLNTH